MKSRTSKKKTTSKPKKTIVKKTIKKTTKKSVKKIQKKAATKPKPKKIIKAKPGCMNDFEQCIVLAAIVNQQRNADTRFLFTPLPDINSTALAPLRELLSQYHFTPNDITKAAHKVFHSEEFKECFALHEVITEALLPLSQKDNKNLTQEILDLAGPEAKKWIYMKEKDSHDIHETTLEKHALKMGLIEPHYTAPEPFQAQDHHKKIIIKLNFQNKGRNFHDNAMRFSGKQHRGRG